MRSTNTTIEDAVRGYADAIKAQSNGAESIDYLLGRASALQKLKRYEEALKDAERAVVLAVEKQKKTSRAQAQFRRGYAKRSVERLLMCSVALYGLKRFADAKFCFDLSARDDPEGKEKSRPIWISKTQAALAKGQYTALKFMANMPR
jgi:suppressor of G2 allele of SKP1